MTAVPREGGGPAAAGPALLVEGLTKLYRRATPGDQLRTLKSALLEGTLTRGLAPENAIVALDGVSFEVAPGEAFGVIGGNGSGKSTLLKVVAGILRPSSGRVAARGRVGALIELGAGFHPEISGRENVYINGAVLGLSRREIGRRFDDIVAFSGLGAFIDEPVKNYSSGMYVRLGFAVAVHTDPDVLLVDEVLAVGDEAFAHRCLRRIEELLAAGKTLVFVSHALDLVEDLCDRVLWLDGGRPRLLGEPRRVVDAYRQAVAEEEGRGHLEAKARSDSRPEAAAGAAEDVERDEAGQPLRWGSRRAEVVSARLLVGPPGEARERYHLASGEAVVFEIEARTDEPLADFVFGIGVSTPRGAEVWGTNTDLAGFEPRGFAGRARVRLACPALRLAPGEYLVDAAVHARDGSPYDYRRKVFAFTVTARDRGVGVYFPEHRWEAEGDLDWEPPALR
ncbi:MAG TPA: ABC transporter ATP-binding protein [Thermoanaerobaculia bacterium]|nr:ABC transporter ATP-binding protein [Thermoanaerobaculia bacterium]